MICPPLSERLYCKEVVRDFKDRQLSNLSFRCLGCIRFQLDQSIWSTPMTGVQSSFRLNTFPTQLSDSCQKGSSSQIEKIQRMFEWFSPERELGGGGYNKICQRKTCLSGLTGDSSFRRIMYSLYRRVCNALSLYLPFY